MSDTDTNHTPRMTALGALLLNSSDDAGIRLLATAEKKTGDNEKFFPCPSFGIFGAAPDVSRNLFFLQLAAYFQNGLPLFDWGTCEKARAAVLAFEEEPRLLQDLLRLLMDGLNQGRTSPLEPPSVFGMKDVSSGAGNATDTADGEVVRSKIRLDQLRAAVGELSSSHRVIFVEGARSMFSSFREYVLAMKDLAYTNEVCLIGTYISRLGVETPDDRTNVEEWRDSLRKPLSYSTFFDEDFDATSLPDWFCLTVQVPLIAINSVLAQTVKDSGARRFYALKFMGAEGRMPEGLRFLSRTQYPMFSTIQLQSSPTGAVV